MLAQVKRELPHIIKSSSRGGVLSSRRLRDHVLVDLLEHLEIDKACQGHKKESATTNLNHKSRMNGCLINSWTDLMESWSRRWIKAKDMISVGLGCKGRLQEPKKRSWKQGSMEKIKFQRRGSHRMIRCQSPYDTVTAGRSSENSGLQKLKTGSHRIIRCQSPYDTVTAGRSSENSGLQKLKTGSHRMIRERRLDRITCGSLPSEGHPELPAGRARVFTWRVKNALEGIAIERRGGVKTPAGVTQRSVTRCNTNARDGQ
ncbi:hypothetical protein EJB05_10725, partial [Eragrostis curvula]